MNRDAVLTIGVTVCCLLAIGQIVGTLDAAVETTPEDAITLGYSLIPLDRDDVDQLRGQLRPGQGEGDASDAPSSAESRTAAAEEAPAERSRGPSTSEAASGPAPAPGTDLLELLRQLLDAIVDALRALAPLLVTIAAIAVSVRYREMLLARLRALLPLHGGATGRPGGSAETAPRPDPRNVVATRWFEMVRLLGLADRRTVTPRDCANAAIEAGVDPDPVERLTALFEEVRYGDEPVTADRRNRSRRALREVVEQYRDGGNR